MALITKDAARIIEEAARKIDGTENLKLDIQVQFTKDIKFGDLQTNAAMTLAKPLRQNPRKIAQTIVENLPEDSPFGGIEIAGPGFINIRLSKESMESYLESAGLAGEPDETGTVVIDYSAPNIAKRMHIGHLGSTIIGESIKRMYNFLGHKTVGDNHIGDWGTQFGKLIVAYREWLDEENYRNNPVEELERLYVLFGRKAEEDEALLVRARKELKKLQDGEPENVALWQEFIDLSLQAYDEIYERLGISFDTCYGESHYHDLMPEVVDELTEKGIARESEGALVVFFPEDSHLHPCIIRKKDGAYLYATSDLACIKSRIKEYNPWRIVYVVDVRQSTHFRQVFTIADMAGWHVEKFHAGFGEKKFKEGTFSSRKGNVIYLSDFLDEAEARAYRVVSEKNPGLSEEVKRDVARMVGTGVVKYSDLSQNRNSTVIFEWDKMLSLEGNTAPYLQYTHARICSIFRKAELDPAEARPELVLTSETERKIVHTLLQFPQAVHMAAESYKPNVISDYVFELAQSFNTFYNSIPVLKEEDQDVRNSRLFICAKTAEIIRKALELLVIEAPEQM
ncbi:MAG: arginine--tRNA ligase [Spirochaetia bacterium]